MTCVAVAVRALAGLWDTGGGCSAYILATMEVKLLLWLALVSKAKRTRMTSKGYVQKTLTMPAKLPLTKRRAGRFLCLVRDDPGADLLVGEELDAGIGKDTEQRGRVALEEAGEASGNVDVADGRGESRPRARVLCELGILRLEEDLDAVERCDYCFCRASSKPARKAALEHILGAPLVQLLAPGVACGGGPHRLQGPSWAMVGGMQ